MKNYDIDHWQGWLIITCNTTGNTAPVKLLDTETGRNITRKQFNAGVEKYGYDKACQVFMRLAANPSPPYYI